MFRRLMLMALPVLIVLAGVLLARYLLTDRPDDPDQAEPVMADGAPGDVPTVAVMTLTSTTATPEWRLYGQWLPQQRLDNLAPSAAEVLTVAVRAGDRVAEGDPLVQLDTDTLERQRSQLRLRQRDLNASERDTEREQTAAEAALEIEQALVQIAERSVDRLRDLQERNLASASDLEEAERNLQQQRRSLRQQQLQVDGFADRFERIAIQQDELALELEQVNEDIADATVRAPFAGEVTSVAVEPNAQVAAQAPLLTLVNDAQGYLEALLPHHQKDALEAGMAATLQHGDAPEQQLDLQLRSWDALNRGGSVRLRLEPATNRETWAFTPVVDAHYAVRLELPALTGIWVLPVTSLYENRHVYQVVDGTLQRRPVQVLGYQERPEGTRVLVRSEPLDNGDGLRQGDAVLVTRLANAITGLPVLVREGN